VDQLKVVLAVLKKHHFWILACIVVAIALTVWATATADVAGRFDARRGQIRGKFDALETIQSDPNHPNEKVIAACADANETTKGNVLRIWETLFQEQKQRNQLPATLSDEFKIYFEEMGPIPSKYREEYQIFIRDYVGKLFYEELNCIRPKNWKFGQERPEKPTLIGVVKWEESNEYEITHRFVWTSPPTTDEIRDAQEELWVYQTLVRIIKNINSGASLPDNAPIKRIEFMQIGEKVQGAGKNPEGIGVNIEKIMADLEVNKAGRYVDQSGLPLVRAGAPPYYEHPFAEFKMMPIRLRLLIEQDKIPSLLVQCANSSMPIEIRRLRLRPGLGSAIQTSASGETVLRQPAQSAASTINENDPTAYRYVPIEVEGIICIYNPPNRDQLGTGAAAEGSPDSLPAPVPPTNATPPAAESPTATTPPAAEPVVPGRAPGTVTGE